MCLAVPGRIVEIKTQAEGILFGATGLVDFQGSRMDIGLDFVPEAKVGDWVLVHAGFAINILDEAAAMEVWDYLGQMGTDVSAELLSGNTDE